MEYERLNRALEMLDKKGKEFSVSEISIDDFMPIKDKIKDLRTVLKEMNARILYLKTVIGKRRISEIPDGDINTAVNKVITETSHCIINDKVLNLCLESDAIEAMMCNDQENLESQEKLVQTQNKLYSLNDEGLTLQNKINNLMLKQLYLKIETQKGAQEYRDFLRQREELRIQKLQQSNPTMAQYKQKMEKMIQKINIMKKLITNFIAGSGVLLKNEPLILEMLENHRDILTLETVSNLVQNDESS